MAVHRLNSLFNTAELLLLQRSHSINFFKFCRRPHYF